MVMSCFDGARISEPVVGGNTCDGVSMSNASALIELNVVNGERGCVLRTAESN